MGMIVCTNCGHVKADLPDKKVYKIYACRYCLEKYKSIDSIKLYRKFRKLGEVNHEAQIKR